MVRDETPRAASTKLILLVGIGTMAWYLIFLLDPMHAGDAVPYAMLLFAEAIAMSQLLGVWLTTLLMSDHPEAPARTQIRTSLQRTHPSNIPSDLVAVFVPVAGEPMHVIEPSIRAARDILLPHRTVVLDDGHSDDVRDLAQRLNVEYLRRLDLDGKKAGNINNGLRHVYTQFFAVLDCDYVADPRFLHETMPPLLADAKLAFVQTPQHYGNRDGFINGGCAEIQDIFYHHVQPGKNAFGAAFCVGTNVVFRREAIDDIGGMYEKSNSEDIWTSVLLHERGWRSYFLEKVLAVGKGPETLGDFFNQQFRWARGGFEILFTRNPLLGTLSLDQKIQYLHTTMHYLSGVAVLIFYLLPLFFAYFGLQPLTGTSGTWLLHFLPYYGFIFFGTTHLLGHWPSWRSIVIAPSAFPAHLSALLSVLTGFNVRWSVTGVIKNKRDYVISISPHLLLLLLSICGVPLLAVSDHSLFLKLQMSFWILLNSVMLASVCKHAFPGALPASARVAVSAPSYA